MRALVSALPRESSTAAATLGVQEAGWDQKTELLATVVDLQQWILHTFVKANFQGNPKAPEPFPRPGVTPQKSEPRRISTTELLNRERGEQPSHPPASAS